MKKLDKKTELDIAHDIVRMVERRVDDFTKTELVWKDRFEFLEEFVLGELRHVQEYQKEYCKESFPVNAVESEGFKRGMMTIQKAIEDAKFNYPIEGGK